jgi:HD-like signal output (HDOD) protein/GGDEF domain-containing protein
MSLDAPLDRVLTRALRKARNLPSPPAVVVQVLKLAQDENSRLEELARVIGQDATLASRLLRLANSSLYGVQFEVRDLQQAAVVMGMRNLKQMCLGLSLSSGLQSAGARNGCKDYSLSVYWQHSLVTSVAAREMARRVGSSLQGEAFLCGLLSRIGQFILARCLAETYQPVVDHARMRDDEGELPSHAVETAVLGYDHAALGARVLRDWGLPAPLPDAVGAIVRLEELEVHAPQELRDLALFAHIGQLAAMVVVDRNKGPALARLRALCSERLDLSADDVDQFLVEIERHVAEAALLTGQDAPTGATFAERLDTARDQLLAARGVLRDSVRVRREPAQEPTFDAESGLVDRESFAERLATLVRLRLEGFDHLCLGLLVIDVVSKGERSATQTVAAALRSSVRSSDLCARIGAAQFAVVAPSTTPQALKLLATRLERVLGNARAGGPPDNAGSGADGGLFDFVIGGVCTRRFEDAADHELLFRDAQSAVATARATAVAVEIRYRRDIERAA